MHTISYPNNTAIAFPTLTVDMATHYIEWPYKGFFFILYVLIGMKNCFFFKRLNLTHFRSRCICLFSSFFHVAIHPLGFRIGYVSPMNLSLPLELPLRHTHTAFMIKWNNSGLPSTISSHYPITTRYTDVIAFWRIHRILKTTFQQSWGILPYLLSSTTHIYAIIQSFFLKIFAV